MAKKRRLFDDLMEGFKALAEQREGKRTLRTYTVKLKSAPKITSRGAARSRHREPARSDLKAGVTVDG